MLMREARPGDAGALMELYGRHLAAAPPDAAQSVPLWEGAIERFSADPNYLILIAEVGGVPVSTVTLVIVENLTHGMRPYALIENVVTHPGHRRMRHATALMAKAVGIAEGRGCYKVMLATGSRSEGTLRFYEGCGFDGDAKKAFVRWL
ncbi:MAG: GNAT family N-acetyltransferase [Oscillospiraceae bacterium]|nr:GNAT family N-acetyltransferase [Oscillospiraceae bacterium]